MKICELSVMRGPNYWSTYRKQVIVMKLDLGHLEDYPSNKIAGFPNRLRELMPSLREHRCSEGHEGGFFKRVEEGTWMGHIVEHVALELQTLAGMEVGFGRTRSADTRGIYYVIFSYQFEDAGLYAAKAAVRICEALAENKPYDIGPDLEELRGIRKDEEYGPSTQSLVDEATRRGIPHRRLNRGSLILLGHGKNQQKIRATMTGATSGLGIDLACDKEDTKMMLKRNAVPVADSVIIRHEDQLEGAIEDIGYPLVIKPVDGNHGRGVTTNIRNAEMALTAFRNAKQISSRVIVEHCVSGYDYRLLVVNYKLVAAALRTPAMIVGNGTSTIRQLIDEINSSPERGQGHESNLTSIKIDDNTLNILSEKGLSLDSVLSFGELLTVKNTANISTGGTSTDVTDRVHPANVLMAERIARIIGLDICGIDIIAKDISKPVDRNHGAVIEVNACPGFRMHLAPAVGLPRNVAAPVIDMLYPKGASARIPIIAITGTNGKTTTTRLVAHMMAKSGYNPGFTTTEGIYINGFLVEEGDCTGSRSAEVVLSDPTVDMAVLECARGGILRSGLGFDHCDISIVTNISEDHLGLKDINTIEEMARVKSVVPRSTFPHGYAILNAENAPVLDMRRDLDCKVALFSMNPANEDFVKHCNEGGLGATIELGCFILVEGKWKTKVDVIENVPLSQQGKAECMMKNILPAILAGKIQGLTPEQIRSSLRSFIPGPALTPGRFNIFKFSNLDVMIDYAHNTDGFVELKKFMDKTVSPCKIGIIAAVGDRRDEDIRNLGHLAGEMFHKVIIRYDKDLRGKSREELADLLIEGIRRAKKDTPVEIIPDEYQAIQQAMESAPPGSFITVCTEKVHRTIDFLNELVEQEKQRNNGSNRGIVDISLSKAS